MSSFGQHEREKMMKKKNQNENPGSTLGITVGKSNSSPLHTFSLQ